MRHTKLFLLPLVLLLSSCGGGTASESTTTPITSSEPISTSSEPISDSSTSTSEETIYTTIGSIARIESSCHVRINVRVVAIAMSTIIIYDGTGSMIVYCGYNHSFKVNDLYTFDGKTALRDGHHQLATSGDTDLATYTKYEGTISEFDYTPTEYTILQDISNVVGQVVKIKGMLAYKSGSYYNAAQLPGDGFYTSSFVGQASYLSLIENATEKIPVAVDMVGIFYAINYATSSGYASRYNFMLTEPLVDTSLDLKDLVISDSMAAFYTTENTFDTDSYLEVKATYTNNASHKVSNDKYEVKVYKDDVLVDTSKKFSETGEYKVKVSYKGTTKELSIIVNTADTVTVMRDPAALAELNSWEDNKASTSKTGKMDDVISLQVYGNGSGNYSTKNNSWTVNQKASGGHNGALEVKCASGYVMKAIKIVYGLNDGDSAPARLGKFIFSDETELKSDEVAILDNLTTLELKVVNIQEEVENAFVRIKSILVQYSAQ